MTVQEGPGGIKTRVIRHDYPVEEGLTAGTTRQFIDSPYLEAEDGSVVSQREKAGF